MRLLLVTAALAAQALTATAVQAAEPFKVYDRFGDPAINPSRWFDTEKSRFIKNGALHLMQRTWGNNASDFNFTTFNWTRGSTTCSSTRRHCPDRPGGHSRRHCACSLRAGKARGNGDDRGRPERACKHMAADEEDDAIERGRSGRLHLAPLEPATEIRRQR